MAYDPMTEDPAVLDARDDEDARAQRWAAFVQVLKDYHGRGAGGSWGGTVQAVADAMDDLQTSAMTDQCQAFAETEGWDGVLSCLARAMREEARDRNELLDRR